MKVWENGTTKRNISCEMREPQGFKVSNDYLKYNTKL